MLFYLFITFQILHFVSCNISCYQTAVNPDPLEYTVTPDHFPVKLEDYSLRNNSIQCSITVTWTRSPNSTIIEFDGDNDMNTGSTPHDLVVSVSYALETSPPAAWAKNIVYQCNTDRCNSLDQLKRLLKALTVNDSLDGLIRYLVSDETFSGEWCYRSSNTTSDDICDTKIPAASCMQCEAAARVNKAGTRFCATCSTEEPTHSEVKYQKTFYMANRTYSGASYILCESRNCNAPAVVASIREKAYIDFNFITFFNAGPTNKITSLCMFFLNQILIILFMRSTL